MLHYWGTDQSRLWKHGRSATVNAPVAAGNGDKRVPRRGRAGAARTHRTRTTVDAEDKYWYVGDSKGSRSFLSLPRLGAESGHSVLSPHRSYWKRYGSVRVFPCGYILTYNKRALFYVTLYVGNTPAWSENSGFRRNPPCSAHTASEDQTHLPPPCAVIGRWAVSCQSSRTRGQG